MCMILLSAAAPGHSCFSPKNGAGWTYEELVTGAEVIVLAEATEVTRDSDFVLYAFRVVEVLKGEIVEPIEFDASDMRVWATDIGRSEFP